MGGVNAQVGIGTTTPSEVLDVETNDANKTAVDINNTGTGDPKINFQINGTSTFSIGVDNSDADKFKIGTSALENNTAITIDASQNVGIGTASPNAAAKLDVSSTTQGFAPPRMTQTQRNDIVSPFAGLMVWCTNCGTTGELQVFNGTTWTNLTGGAASATVPGAPTSPVGTAGNTQVSVAFTAPASNGGSAITGYTVTSSPGGFTAMGASSPLVVTGLTNGTAYTFTVVATNAAGNSVASTASAAVTPRTVPGAPTSPVATAGNAQASVAFTAPASNGGSAITGYTVTSSPGSLTATGASSPLVVTGLTNGTAYTFTVVATNAAGNSVASSASAAVTPRTVPGAPTSPVATAGNAQASVAFTAPASNGGSTITSYTVTSSPGSFTATGASSPLVVTGLTNGTAYTFTVVATNAAGNSVASAASAAVTPSVPPFTCGTSTVTFTYNGASVTYGTVSRAYGGAVGTKCWLDRNLGATRVAQSSTDHLAYGDLFQGGRGADGHQRINWTSSTAGTGVNGTTTTLSSTDSPGTALYITNGTIPYDWRSPQNNSLWQGVSGINNPCPSGYRLPTNLEIDAERASWSSQNSTGAFASPLKLPMSGLRDFGDGSIQWVGGRGILWSSTVIGTNFADLFFNDSSASVGHYYRANGRAVRCIKD